MKGRDVSRAFILRSNATKDLKFVMMKPLTVEQMREADRWAIHDIGVPSLALMENAGAGASREVVRMLEGVNGPKVSVFCGTGNNGGDGFVIVRHLLNAGFSPKVFLIGHSANLSEDAYVNYRILQNVDYPVETIDHLSNNAVQALKESDLIIDAVFGSGLSREVKEPQSGIITAINQAGKKVLAVDIPSGLDGTSGNIHGVCVKADVTATFHAPKTGFYEGQGPEVCGEIVVIDIGIPAR